MHRRHQSDRPSSLIHPNDVTIRLATLPSAQGLGAPSLAFLYDPFYLEFGMKSYIFDWATSRAKREIVELLKDNADGNESPVFHTFTYSKSKVGGPNDIFFFFLRSSYFLYRSNGTTLGA